MARKLEDRGEGAGGTRKPATSEQEAARLLLAVLESVTPWERYPADVAQWTASQRRERMAPMPGYVMVTGRRRDGSRFRHELPEGDLEQHLEELRSKCDEEPQVRRNAIDARRGGVRMTYACADNGALSVVERGNGVREHHRAIGHYVALAADAVLRAGGRPEALRELERDDQLHTDTVQAAIAELRRVLGAETVDTARPPTPAEAQVPHGRLCAVCDGIGRALLRAPDGLRQGPLGRRVGQLVPGAGTGERNLRRHTAGLEQLGLIARATRCTVWKLTSAGRAEWAR